MPSQNEMQKKQTKARRNAKRNNSFLSVLFVISLCVFLYSSYRIAAYLVEDREQKNLNENIIEEAIQKIPVTDFEDEPTVSTSLLNSSPSLSSTTVTTTKKPKVIMKRPDISVNFQVLNDKYQGLVGWLYGQDEIIHNPVMQWQDNDFFLTRLPNGVANAAGSLFMDYRDPANLSGWNHIIYGHNMQNGSMFGFLHDYRRAGFFEENPYLFYFTQGTTYRLELFAGIHTKNDSFVYTHPQTDEDKLLYLNKAKKLSVFTSSVNVSHQDRIIVLSTCAGAIDAPDRFVIMAKLVALS